MDVGIWIGLSALLISAATIIANTMTSRTMVSAETVRLLEAQLTVLRAEGDSIRNRLREAEVANKICETRCETLQALVVELTAKIAISEHVTSRRDGGKVAGH